MHLPVIKQHIELRTDPCDIEELEFSFHS